MHLYTYQVYRLVGILESKYCCKPTRIPFSPHSPTPPLRAPPTNVDSPEGWFSNLRTAWPRRSGNEGQACFGTPACILLFFRLGRFHVVPSGRLTSFNVHFGLDDPPPEGVYPRINSSALRTQRGCSSWRSKIHIAKTSPSACIV